MNLLRWGALFSKKKEEPVTDFESRAEEIVRRLETNAIADLDHSRERSIEAIKKQTGEMLAALSSFSADRTIAAGGTMRQVVITAQEQTDYRTQQRTYTHPTVQISTSWGQGENVELGEVQRAPRYRITIIAEPLP